ncbi:DUF4145 domain-containing protein [Albibacterium bauzanense]|uniref:Uncharacterized protein DUF4145 n=1 Tax=Albibacterium bauzanense TaxID=653929 RepID=A0A4R1M3V5_9SPHI|nr:DUF4145 domain-containing protein [Albibacterium bauzanense]TCK85554.1 uncharacterized protein DUF4145 [Albibacterium bauzanense]
MIFKLTGLIQNSNGTRISTRCPHCGHNGTFESVGADIQNNNKTFGLRRCPNGKCFGHLFFIYNNQSSELIITHPSDTIPFDKENIPDKVLNAFQEAIISHSNNCFIASAIMIRKTLEEICVDRGATGKNLYARLQDLGTKIVIPKELIEGMQELRLLGNDAAHIESNTFDEVGKNEVEISIEFTKEILKAVYQYESLLSKLRSLKKPTE